MSAVMKLFFSGVRQIFRDGMLSILIPAPFLMGAALWFALPFADSLLLQEMDFTIKPWFSLSDGFLMVMTPVMIGMVFAFLLLDERDEGIGIYYRITPAGGSAYLIARLGIPMIWSFFISLLVLGFFGLSLDNLMIIIIVAALGSLQGVISCLFLAVLAGNKVEGLALSKLLNITVLGLPIAWFINEPYRYLLGFLPSFWIGEVIYTSIRAEALPILINSFAGLLSSLVWIIVLIWLFLFRENTN